jgi:hypothetical protein
MRAAGLLLAFAAAKFLMLAGRELEFDLIVYLWQDVLVALAFGIVEYFRPSRALYAGLALYAAVNVPVARVLSTPLTWPLLQAAGGPLSDSIFRYATWPNLASIAAVLGIAWLSPRLLRNYRPGPVAVAASVLFVAVGPAAAREVETVGLERNAVAAVLTGLVPRVSARGAQADWRVSPFPSPGAREDLTRYRGAAAGMNVLLVSLESTGAEYLKPYGAAEDPMPNLTRLAEQGIVFENCYCVYPESIKGLLSVLASLSPAIDVSAETHGEARRPTLASALAGYRTALFHSGRFPYLGMESIVRHRGFEVLEDAGDIGGDRNSSFGIDEPSTVRRILRWIDGVDPGGRFFVHYLPIAGHHPYVSPGGPFGRDEIGEYRNALHYGDESLGVLIEGLRRRGLDHRTLVVLYGDHGEAFEQHAGNVGHTMFIYEENVRVPLVLWAPGVLEPARASRLSSLIDVAPTILDLLGLPIPRRFEGVSLLEPEDRMSLFFTDYSMAWLGLRDGPWKALHEAVSGRTRLFDLESDPGERRDISAEQPARARVYSDLLRRWSSAQRARVIEASRTAPSAPDRPPPPRRP